jgi:Zn-dependent protease with chaperone function
MTKNAKKLVTVIAVASLATGLWFSFRGMTPSCWIADRLVPPLVPTRLSLADFQTDADKDLMKWLSEADDSPLTKVADEHLVKPLSDDVRTRMLAIQGIEVTPEQFPELDSAVKTCARILHLEKVPRVFVSASAQFPITTENYAEPVLIIQPGTLDRFKEPVELRFLIGREFGHAKAGHTRWRMLVKRMNAITDKFNFLGDANISPFLPILRWARESEMTADNAGLICAQDEKSCELVLLRLATGADDSKMGKLNVEAYLHQCETEHLSDYSEAVLLWREWNRPTPFAPSRIGQLRQYRESARYQSLWK